MSVNHLFAVVLEQYMAMEWVLYFDGTGNDKRLGCARRSSYT